MNVFENFCKFSNIKRKGGGIIQNNELEFIPETQG